MPENKSEPFNSAPLYKFPYVKGDLTSFGIIEETPSHPGIAYRIFELKLQLTKRGLCPRVGHYIRHMNEVDYQIAGLSCATDHE